jgi:predicted ribosome quality control (RQC) complex YloA/Tae2 family protein
MAMTWDSVLVAAAATELNASLGGKRLRAVHLDHHGRSALLHFPSVTLALRLHPEEGTLTRLEAGEPDPEASPIAGVVSEVLAPPDDRLLLIRGRRLRGSREAFLVAVELMTNQWNVVLAFGQDDRIRHVLRSRSDARVLRPGEAYLPPPPSTREGVRGDLSRERWHEVLHGLEPPAARRALLAGVAWTSSLNVDALLGAGDDGHALWHRLASAHTGAEPVVLGSGPSARAYPLALPGLEAHPARSVLEALDIAARAPTGGTPSIPAGWIEALARQAHRAEGRVRALEGQLASAPDPSSRRALGDLLLARFHEVPRGASRVTLTDFTGEAVELALDPELPVQDNAARYYDEAARAERARERLPGLLDRARGELDAVRDLLERARNGDASPAEVREALPAATEATGGRVGPSLPYRTYRSSGGLEIRVGRGARHNDRLTFQHSSPSDVWLHARHAAGAHVVLRWSGDGNPPARDLAEAATLAALSSQARHSGSVPVDWTRRKYVRKPRKAPPGTVLLDRARTLFVEPDPMLEERLREE